MFWVHIFFFNVEVQWIFTINKYTSIWFKTLNSPCLIFGGWLFWEDNVLPGWNQVHIFPLHVTGHRDRHSHHLDDLSLTGSLQIIHLIHFKVTFLLQLPYYLVFRWNDVYVSKTEFFCFLNFICLSCSK